MKICHFVSLALVALFMTALQAAEISVFAAASLTDAMKELAPVYESKSGHKLLFNFAGSNALARQIREGAPADIFFSADEIQMDKLAKDGLIDPATHANLLSNTLVIVVPTDGPAELPPAALARPSVRRIALAGPRERAGWCLCSPVS
jgi:molybdate transport system substrate-binding protein